MSDILKKALQSISKNLDSSNDSLLIAFLAFIDAYKGKRSKGFKVPRQKDNLKGFISKRLDTLEKKIKPRTFGTMHG